MVVDYIFSKLNIKKMENRNWFSIFYSIKFIRSNNKITFTLIRTFIFLKMKDCIVNILFIVFIDTKF